MHPLSGAPKRGSRPGSQPHVPRTPPPTTPSPHFLRSLSGKFTTVKDTQDGYEFAYPFGWQEVT